MNGLLLSHTVNLRGKNYILIHIRNLFPTLLLVNCEVTNVSKNHWIFTLETKQWLWRRQKNSIWKNVQVCFLTFFNSVKAINRHPFTPFLLCGRLGEIDLLSWLLINSKSSLWFMNQGIHCSIARTFWNCIWFINGFRGCRVELKYTVCWSCKALVARFSWGLSL